MFIDSFKRDEDNEVIAICGDVEIPLTAAYIVANKPQIGDELIFDEPTVEE
jgi:hypothetical protein